MEQLGSEQQGMLRKRLQHLEHQLHRQLMHTASGGVSHIFAELYALREQVDKPADHDWSMMDSTWLLSGLPSHLRSLLNFSAAAQVNAASQPTDGICLHPSTCAVCL